MALPDSPPMRIALFSEVYWPMVSGVGVTLLRLTEELEARGHTVRVYSAAYTLPDSGDRPEVHRSNGVPLFLYPEVHWAFPRQKEIVADLAAFRPDIVHVATEFALGLAGIKAAQQLDLPLVASAHTDYQKYAARYGVEWALQVGWIYLRWFYGHASKVLCPSRVYERFLHSRGVDHTGLWTRGVDPAVFHPRFRSEEYRRSFGLGPEDLLVTYIGRIAKEKDLDRMVKAWVALGERRGNAQLVLVGQGPLAEELQRHQIPCLHLTGLKQGRELSEAYASADIFTFPSPTETFGNSLLEAMASGLPSHAVDAGGVLDYVRHEQNALVSPARDIEGMHDALGRLLEDAALRRRLAQGGLRTAAARDWESIYDALVHDYRSIAEEHEAAAAA